MSFYHAEKRLGKVLTLRGDETEALTVRLGSCGAVCGRVVDRAGHPVSGQGLWFGRGDNGLDVKAVTDLQGKFRADLVPGLTYRMPSSLVSRPVKDVDELVVAPGQTKDLGDLPVADRSPKPKARSHLDHGPAVRTRSSPKLKTNDR